MYFKKIFLLFILGIIIIITGCSLNGKKNLPKTTKADTKMNNKEKVVGNTYKDWNKIIKEGKNKTVTIYMWSGNDKVNKYLDEYVSTSLKDKYGIIFKRENMEASKYIAKLLDEKQKKVNEGDGDLLWVSGESFKNCKQLGLIWGPFTSILPNQNKYFDLNAEDVQYDTGLVTEGYEALWGKKQLIFNYDTSKIKTPPKSYTELLAWVKNNKGKFAHVKFNDSYETKTFFRNAYYELVKNQHVYKDSITKEQFIKSLEPVKAYFEEFKKYTWMEGQEYPPSLKQLEDLFRNGNVNLSMSFDIFKVKYYVDNNIYPGTIENYVFDGGTITTPHYLAIPFNSKNKAASMLAIDFLQSPEAQIEKAKYEVWGDQPAIDVNKVDDKQKDAIADIEKKLKVNFDLLNKKSLPEMKLEQIEWFNEYFLSSLN